MSRLFMALALAGAAVAAPAQAPDRNDGRVWIDAGDYEGFHAVTPERPSPLLQTAADAFCRYWKQATHAEITASPVNEGRINVWLGADIVTREMLDPADLEGLSPEGSLVRTYTPGMRYASKGARKQLVIAGTTDAGTLHGVYTFFSQMFGARWLAPGVTLAPSAKFTLRNFELRSDAAVPFREAGVFGQWHGAGAEEFRRGVHLPAAFVPPPPGPDLFRAAPGPVPADAANTAEYGSDAGADRLAEALAVLVRADGTADADTRARRERAAWPPGTNTWSLNAVDWLAPAGAAECAARDAAEGAPAASLLYTANRVAGRLAELFPDAPPRVHLLLAPAVRRAPKTLRPAEHVIVQLSAEDLDFSRPMEDPANAAFAGDLRGWSRLGGTLWVADRAVNRRDARLPFPNLHALPANVLFCIQNGVSGVYALGGLAEKEGSADLAELRGYLWAQMLWNPDVPFDDLLREYCDIYYGPAGAAVLSVIGMQEAAVKASGKPLRADDDGAWLDAATLGPMQKELETALALPNLPPDKKPRVEAVLASLNAVQATR